MAITQDLVLLLSEECKGHKVSRVVLEIGKLSAVLPDAVRFCFDLCTEGTIAEGAVLEIVETPGLGRCRACGLDVALERPFGRCSCGSSDLAFLAGEELRLKEVEVVENSGVV
jgi:hydrogenase nickel incorporation protein HypA/HybF